MQTIRENLTGLGVLLVLAAISLPLIWSQKRHTRKQQQRVRNALSGQF